MRRFPGWSDLSLQWCQRARRPNRHKSSFCVSAVPCAFVVVTFIGCSTRKAAEKELMACVAASVQDIVNHLAKDFESQTGIVVRLNSGASGTLRTQIERGAPCDVFLSADPRDGESLIAAGKVLAENVSQIAANRLVVAIRREATLRFDEPADLLAESIRRIGLAEPDVAPLGRYAKQALTGLNLWTPLQNKLTYGQDARAVSAWLSRSLVDAAILYQTDVRASPDLRVAFVFPRESHEPVRYVGMAVGLSPRKEASDFLRFVSSPGARAAWVAHGFDPPDSETKP